MLLDDHPAAAVLADVVFHIRELKMRFPWLEERRLLKPKNLRKSLVRQGTQFDLLLAELLWHSSCDQSTSQPFVLILMA